MGKGSKQRPQHVPADKFESNWDNIFNRKKPTDAELQESAWLKNEYHETTTVESVEVDRKL